MKKLLLILLCLPMIGFGQNVNIPDANFKAFLVANSGINTNGDTEIQVSEATAFNGIIGCYGLSISDLTGIEYFVSIQGLGCSQNQLTNLDISSNSNLQILNCGDNQLTSLDISNNPNLYFLTCYNNYLSSLDLRNGYNNQFDSVWAYGNPNLTCISVDDSVYSTNNWTAGILPIAVIDPQHYFSNNCSNTPSWDCNNGVCNDPGTGNGQYSTQAACTAVCGVSVIQEHTTNKELLKVTDILGRETKQTNQPLFYIYDDGTLEKRIVIE